MNIQNRITKLEQQQPVKDDAFNVALMKPSAILAAVNELMAQGAELTDDTRARVESLRAYYDGKQKALEAFTHADKIIHA